MHNSSIRDHQQRDNNSASSSFNSTTTTNNQINSISSGDDGPTSTTTIIDSSPIPHYHHRSYKYYNNNNDNYSSNNYNNNNLQHNNNNNNKNMRISVDEFIDNHNCNEESILSHSNNNNNNRGGSAGSASSKSANNVNKDKKYDLLLDSTGTTHTVTNTDDDDDEEEEEGGGLLAGYNYAITTIADPMEQESCPTTSRQHHQVLLQDEEREAFLEEGTVTPRKARSRGANKNTNTMKIVVEEDNTGSSSGSKGDEECTGDCYQLMFMGDYRYGFAFAMFVFAVQLSLNTLILFGMVDLAEGLNGRWMRVPPGVRVSVNIAQFLGVILIVFFVYSNGDLLKGISNLMEGYDESVLNVTPYATKHKFLLSCLCQSLVGFVMQVALFILMMQSTSVLGLCLNFAALHFVAEIDDAAFYFASQGVLSSRLKMDCDNVLQVQDRVDRKKQTRFMRRVLLLLVTLIMFFFYAYCITLQWNGYFLCDELFVQFGDSFVPELAHYTGRFSTQGSNPRHRIDSRTVYIDHTSSVRLAYCENEKAWVFSWIQQNDDNAASSSSSRPGPQHCDYFLKSSETETFDVIDIGTAPWTFRNMETHKVGPADWIFLGCDDCTEDTCQPGRGTCSGSIDDDNDGGGICVCNDGFLGRSCEFEQPEICDRLGLDLRQSDFIMKSSAGIFFAESGYRGFRTIYENDNYNNNTIDEQQQQQQRQQGQLLQFQNHPVYLTNYESVNGRWDHGPMVYNFGIIMFTGRRWILFGKNELEKFSVLDEYQYFQDLLTKNSIQQKKMNEQQHEVMDLIKNTTFWDKGYRPHLFSAPMDYSTNSYSVNPIGLDWFLVKQNKKQQQQQQQQYNSIKNKHHNMINQISSPSSSMSSLSSNQNNNNVFFGWYADEGQLTGAKLQCADCHPDRNPCQNGGICVNNNNNDHQRNSCECPQFFRGTLCEEVITCTELGGCLNNGGICNEYHYCEDCIAPFSGNLCQLYPKEQKNSLPFSCVRDPCKNNGQCNILKGTCTCQYPFGGQQCEKVI